MEHFILRCKHCNKEYTYCTYGNGSDYGTEEGCSTEYCAECQKAIDNALKKIPKRFEDRPIEIHEPRLEPLFEKIAAEHMRTVGNEGLFPMVIGFSPLECGFYDNCEIFIHNRKKFSVCWNDETPNDRHIHLYFEYDLLNNKLTDKVWKYYGEEDSYRKGRNTAKYFARKLSQFGLTPSKPFDGPTGELFYFDFKNDSEPVTKHQYEAPKKQHIPITRNHQATGLGIKKTLEHGYGSVKLTLTEGLSSDDLLDFIDYEYTFVKYDDEDTGIITDIKCI